MTIATIFYAQIQNQSNETRRQMMQQANPKYILRSWMSMLAYEK